ncbi:MAG: class I SAM-dependent methyltransferase [Hyphomicrobiales bacterium]
MSSDFKDRPGDETFQARRMAIARKNDALPGAMAGDAAERAEWYEQVYSGAEGDAAGVPWADLRPKDVLVNWLKKNPGNGRRALDIACGLGDNAEAIADAGYRTVGFDIAATAVDWARRRFPASSVDYCVADLFAPPEGWVGGFDLVNECYTIQSLTGPIRDAAFAAVAGLVAPGGRLLVIARTKDDYVPQPGPPWPLTPSELARFEELGLTKLASRNYVVERPGRVIPHKFIVYGREG